MSGENNKRQNSETDEEEEELRAASSSKKAKVYEQSRAESILCGLVTEQNLSRSVSTLSLTDVLTRAFPIMII